jgi:transposase
MAKGTRARYTLEFKLEAVRMVKGGQSLRAVSKILGIAEQTLHNWIKADREGRLTGPGAKPVSAEQMEIARLRAVLARVKMERDIPGKATAHFAKERVELPLKLRSYSCPMSRRAGNSTSWTGRLWLAR